MGEEAELAVERAIFSGMDLESNYDDVDFDYWECKDGTQIKFSKMRTSHIKNCINMIERKEGWREEWLEVLKEELESRLDT